MYVCNDKSAGKILTTVKILQSIKKLAISTYAFKLSTQRHKKNNSYVRLHPVKSYSGYISYLFYSELW